MIVGREYTISARIVCLALLLSLSYLSLISTFLVLSIFFAKKTTIRAQSYFFSILFLCLFLKIAFICFNRQCSKESIHQLVLDAENLIREETTKKSCSALAEVMLMSSTSSSRRKCEKKMMHNPKIKRVQVSDFLPN